MKVLNDSILQGMNMQGTMIVQRDKTDAFQKQLELAAAKQEDAALKEACQQFEAYFIQQMWKEMRSTLSDDGLIPKNRGEEIFQEMLDAEYSKKSSEGQGIGIAQTLYRQLSKRNNQIL
ncbi:MAG: flagellar biosynthesis protein FlgJ [Epulopiscium sp.]|nr:flagellar biosynthesis protein FlgJ [Candidatus Epulonipiscium sp.]